MLLEYIDNIYSDIDNQRNIAISQEYSYTTNNNNSPGKSKNLIIDESNEAYIKIKQFFSNYDLRIFPYERKYRIAYESDIPTTYIHTDICDFNIIISLTKEHDIIDDVETIYESELEEENKYLSDLSVLRYQFDEEYKKNIQDKLKDCFILNKFKTIKSCKFKYNRAIIIDSRHFHCPTKPNFGTCNETVRLVEIYSINILSKIKEIPYYPYIWVYNNVFREEIIYEIEQNALKLLKFKNTEFNNNIEKIEWTDILYYRGAILKKCVNVYIEYIFKAFIDIHTIFLKKYNRVQYNIEANLIKIPKNINHLDWSYDIVDNNSHINIIIPLSHSTSKNTGISIYNHFYSGTNINKKNILLPFERNSIIIFPQSWLYPMRIFSSYDEFTYLLFLTVSFV